MLVMKLLFKVAGYSIAAFFLAAFFFIAIVYLIVKELFKAAWFAAFPKRLRVNSYGMLTEEDEEDLNNYYIANGLTDEDNICWYSVRP